MLFIYAYIYIYDGFNNSCQFIMNRHCVYHVYVIVYIITIDGPDLFKNNWI